MTEQEQIEEMAKAIRPILENRTDICFIPDLDKPIAKELLKHYQPKLPKDSVVLSREEYNDLILAKKTFASDGEEVSSDTLLSTFKGIKEQARKETAEKFLQLAYDRCLEKSFIKKVEELAKQFGVEIKE